MNSSERATNDPISPEELERLKVIYETARYTACLSRHDPLAERLAAMAIRFYQLGIRDDGVLIDKIVETSRSLRQSYS
ncbi:hypothetical protein [Neorhizobium alkalisoli]|uniref:Uncharacterized protein n=1 Tax=Neorhizobium alkalisoli TaxID=528178 RepID=A0A561R2L8_9HYPH|nr:hypothetical protein [Neorhizobium alkalisoli]TWF56841.1 hypothetical protein FHW37_102480 [Neorhizobium alkalisoli]